MNILSAVNVVYNALIKTDNGPNSLNIVSTNLTLEAEILRSWKKFR